MTHRTPIGLGVLAVLALGCRTVPAELPVDTRTESNSGNPVFVESQPTRAQPAPGTFEPVSASIVQLYRCWFRNPYEYMFQAGGPPLELDGRQFGMLMAGVRGILFYGDLNTCAGELVGQPPASYSDIAPLEALAGVSATVPAPNLQFSAVNPEFIAYARRNLIPSPDQPIDGVPTQLAYDRVFQRFFRLQTASLLMLLETTDIDREVAQYLDDTNVGVDGIEWLEGRYAGSVPGFDEYRDYTTMTPSMAAGFWLRRRADGSFAASWYGLHDVLIRYDAQWWAEQQILMPKAAATLEQLPDPLERP